MTAPICSHRHRHHISVAVFGVVSVLMLLCICYVAIFGEGLSSREETGIVAPSISDGTLRPGQHITIRRASGHVQCSSGFVVEDDRGIRYLVTARHCFTGEDEVVIGDHVVGRGVLPDSFLDYALVPLSPTQHIFQTFTTTGTPRRGDRICKIGYKTGRTCDTVSLIVPGYIASTVWSDRGDSGGDLESQDGKQIDGILSCNLMLPRKDAPSAFVRADSIMESINSGDVPGVNGRVHILTMTLPLLPAVK